MAQIPSAPVMDHTSPRDHAMNDNPSSGRGWECEGAVEAIVASWCLEGDASVILPQMRRRHEQQQDSAAAGDADAAAPIERCEAAIAKRLALAIVRKIRAGLTLSGAASSTSLTPTRSAVAMDSSPLLESSSAVSLLGDKRVSPQSPANHSSAFAGGSDDSPTSPPSAQDAPSSASAVAVIVTETAATPSQGRLHQTPPQQVVGESDRLAASDAIELFPAFSVNYSLIDPGATMPRSATPNHLSASGSGGTATDARLRKELTHALTDTCRALLSCSRQLLQAGTQVERLTDRVQRVEEEIAAAKSSAARLDIEALHLKQQLAQSQNRSRRVSVVTLGSRTSSTLQHQHQPRPERAPTFAFPPIQDLVLPSPSVRSPLSAKGSVLFPPSQRAVRMQQHAEESIDDIGMPMLNQYVILSELGAGCQGTVNLALDTETEELRAIKVITRPIATSAAARRRETASSVAQLQREIAIMKRCRHKNVVTLFEVIDDPEADSMYLVMQYVEKGCVAKLSATGETMPIDGTTLASYAKQLCSGLQYLHSRGIVHRDVKPENILLGANGVVYLSDFGISSFDDKPSCSPTPRGRPDETALGLAGVPSPTKLPCDGTTFHHSPLGGEERSDSVELNSSVTLSSVRAASMLVRGTRAFLAPELLVATTSAPTIDQECSADVWALGMSLYVMLYGHLPWPATSAAQYMEQVVSPEVSIPYPATTRDGQRIVRCEEWANFLSRMLCREQKDRVTAAQAYDAVKALLRDAARVEIPVAEDDVQRAITAVRRSSFVAVASFFGRPSALAASVRPQPPAHIETSHDSFHE